MPSHSETRLSPYTPEQLMAMVLDIEKYPEFLPWCRAARVLERHEEYFWGELVIRFNHLTERYTSKISPSAPGADPEIRVELVRGPFSHLSNHWRFVPVEQGTEIHFQLDFAFRSSLLERLMGGLFARATEKMTAAFLQRADALYKSA